jgi:hypothetical protein
MSECKEEEVGRSMRGKLPNALSSIVQQQMDSQSLLL